MSQRLHLNAVPWGPVGGALLSGVLQTLVFPRAGWAWLAPVCLVPLLLALQHQPGRRSFALGWLCGMAYWGGTCYWIYPVMRDYAGIAPAIAGSLFAAFFLVKGLHAGVFGLLASRLLPHAWAVPALAALWVGIEGSHQYIFFTWTQLGNAALEFPAPQVLRLAPWTGIYGPSLVFAGANAAIAVAVVRRSPRPLATLTPLLGLLLLPPLPPPQLGTSSARLVQPNVHPDLLRTNWTAEHGTAHLAKMLDLSRTARPDRPRPSLVIWPEYPVSAYYFDDAGYRAFLERVARESGSTFIFNTISFEDGDRAKPRNSSATLASDGTLLSQYSKMHLVPFGEFVPWPFHYFVQKITMESGTFQPGDRIAVARTEDGTIATFICYESVFARSIRKFTAAGAQLLVNISNDSWYGRSAARDQHLWIARMRAVENSRWILRATNDGITSAIDPAGRVAAALPSYQQATLDVQFDYQKQQTGFVRYGEWLWWLCVSAALGPPLLATWPTALRRKRKTLIPG